MRVDWTCKLCYVFNSQDLFEYSFDYLLQLISKYVVNQSLKLLSLGSEGQDRELVIYQGRYVKS